MIYFEKQIEWVAFNYRCFILQFWFLSFPFKFEAVHGAPLPMHFSAHRWFVYQRQFLFSTMITTITTTIKTTTPTTKITTKITTTPTQHWMIESQQTRNVELGNPNSSLIDTFKCWYITDMSCCLIVNSIWSFELQTKEFLSETVPNRNERNCRLKTLQST